MGSRIASWSLSGVQSDTWRVYSSLLLPDGQHITTIDCKSGNANHDTLTIKNFSLLAGLLAVGTPSSLAVYTLVLENDLPTWSLKWSLPYVNTLLSCMTTFANDLQDWQGSPEYAFRPLSCILRVHPRCAMPVLLGLETKADVSSER
jgi:hypothetical protein